MALREIQEGILKRKRYESEDRTFGSSRIPHSARRPQGTHHAASTARGRPLCPLARAREESLGLSFPLEEFSVSARLQDLEDQHRRSWNRMLWKPQQLTDGDQEAADHILENLAPLDLTQARLESFRDTFIFINGFRSMEDAIPSLFHQLQCSRLALSSISKYIGKMLKGIVEGSNCRRVRKAANLLASLEDTKTATSFPVPRCIEIYEELRTKDALAGAAMEMMPKTGLRYIDLTYLGECDVVFSRSLVTICVRFSKNRRARRDRIIARLPLWFGEISSSTQRRFTSGSGFAGRSTQSILRSLQKVCKEASTYSFRRAFMRRAIIESGFDFVLAARRFTLHKNPDTLRAYYDSLEVAEVVE